MSGRISLSKNHVATACTVFAIVGAIAGYGIAIDRNAREQEAPLNASGLREEMVRIERLYQRTVLESDAEIRKLKERLSRYEDLEEN